ncbi:ATP-binding protein [Streptomyces sp. NPDC021224]|uniref:ATP-binding protein n=1 Tax=unclassified Streptomyces TaxID=2593676 RepID=UPI00379D9DD6
MRPTTTDQSSAVPEPEIGRALPGTPLPGSAAPAGTETGGGPADPLGARVDALGELLGLSRARISPDALAETGELLERIGERRRLSHEHTVVALAGATGSGKSSLFNALAGLPLSATGLRRPTTARPVSCAWHPERAAGLLDRLGIAPQDRYARRPRIPAPADAPDRAAAPAGDAEPGTDAPAGPGADGAGPAAAVEPEVGDGGHGGADGIPVGDGGFSAGSGEVAARPGGERLPGRGGDTAGGGTSLGGLILIDLPDHDSAAPGHRAQVDRLLGLVDVVVWVLDPEKYADAALHERYLRPLAGHADVTVLVLNQVDRLPGDSADLVLDDLRRLLDEDGLAVGEHGEAGAVVLATSALTGQGVADLRGVLAQIVAERAAAGRRLAADLDRTADRLRPLYVAEGGAGLTDPAREEFVDRLADAVGAAAAGQSAERDWAAAARAACGTPWGRLRGERTTADAGSREAPASPDRPKGPVGGAGAASLTASRPLVGEAVRGLAADAARGLPAPWGQAVRDAARRGGEGLPAALDAAAGRAEPGPPEHPGWWSFARGVQWLLMALAVAGAVCLITLSVGSLELAWWPPVVMVATGGAGGPLVSAVCRAAARGPARRHGQAAERRLRDAAADCGRARVLEPVAAELMRYREVREQFAVVAAASPVSPRVAHARDSHAVVSHTRSSE